VAQPASASAAAATTRPRAANRRETAPSVDLGVDDVAVNDVLLNGMGDLLYPEWLGE